MIELVQGVVLEVLSSRPGARELMVGVEGRREKAVAYGFSGEANPGKTVLLNVTASRLGLGTGGYHFVLPSSPLLTGGEGHLMKLRYTPLQFSFKGLEEEVRLPGDLGGLPVVCCELHSQVAAAAGGIRASDPSGRVFYVMTDGGALPAGFSRLVPLLRQKGLVDRVITAGQSFGGDYEAVNLYSAFLGARALGADYVVCGMGPGVLGTGTAFGFSGIDQGQALNAALSLEGTAIAAVRMSFAEGRERHRGISHHTLTVLGKVVLGRCLAVIPGLEEEKERSIEKEIARVAAKHEIVRADGEPGLRYLQEAGIELSTMGRKVHEDREFFLAAAAAGACAVMKRSEGPDESG